MKGACHRLTTRVRFLVDDVRTAAQWIERKLDITTDPVTTLPGVVAFTNFDDPWGNHLGYYQDIVPSSQQPETGGSVSDKSLYQTDPTNRT